MHAPPTLPLWNLARRFRWLGAIMVRMLIFVHEHAQDEGPIARALRNWMDRRLRVYERLLRCLIVMAALRRMSFTAARKPIGGAPRKRSRMNRRAIRALAGMRLPPRGSRARIEALVAIAAHPEPYIARLVRRLSRGIRALRRSAREAIARSERTTAQCTPARALFNSS